MNQLQAQQHMQDLVETFRIAYPMAFSASREDRSEIIDGIAFMLRKAIEENDATSAAMVGVWFASRAPKPVLLAFLAFLEDDGDNDKTEDEWPDEIGVGQ